MGENLLYNIDLNNIPEHIALILDGNGRWAKKRFLPRFKGHQEGMKRLVEIVEESNNLGVKYLSVFAFSTENWKRPKIEVNSLMDLLVLYVELQLEILNKNNVKINILGDITSLPSKPKKAILSAVEYTSNNTGMVLNIAINYGGRSDIVNSIKEVISKYENKIITLEDINEDLIRANLYTKEQPDIDFLIRTGGEKRISNFMLYQMAYAELYFTECLWPDFNKIKLYEAILDYQNRNRRFGGI